MPNDTATSQGARIRADRDRFVAMAFCWADILIECDSDEKIVFAVGPTESQTGRKSSELIGSSLEDMIFNEDLSLIRGLLAIPRKSGRIEDASIRLRDKNGKASDPLLFVGYRLEDLGDHYFMAFRSSKSAGAPRGQEKGRDGETGLQDADSFADRVKDAVASGEIGEDSMLSLISLQGMEDLSGRMDDEAEQRLLNTLGTYLKANSVDGDMASRIGDNRFGLVHDASVNIADIEKQITKFSQEADPTGQGIEVEAASLEMDSEAVSQEDIANGLSYTLKKFQNAKEGEFDLKNLEESFGDLLIETADKVREFRKLVTAAEFDVAFHPILHTVTGEIHHYEALVRFKKDGSGVSPFETITFAEEAGLIPEFDLAMATKVIQLLANIPDRYHVAINISGYSVGDADYVAGLQSLLAENQWASDRVIFEITESSRMADLDAANVFIQMLRKDGYEVCLDDFGAGAASFQYLSTLDVDVVKLDGSAVKNAQKAKKGKAFLKALARFCRELGVHTIGEMVDTPETLEFVRECGVEFVQGFLFGEPNTDILSFAKMDKDVEKLFGRKSARKRAFG